MRISIEFNETFSRESNHFYNMYKYILLTKCILYTYKIKLEHTHFSILRIQIKRYMYIYYTRLLKLHQSSSAAGKHLITFKFNMTFSYYISAGK